MNPIAVLQDPTTRDIPRSGHCASEVGTQIWGPTPKSQDVSKRTRRENHQEEPNMQTKAWSSSPEPGRVTPELAQVPGISHPHRQA